VRTVSPGTSSASTPFAEPDGTPAPSQGRRRGRGVLLLAALAALAFAAASDAAERRYVIAVANLTEEPGVTIESTGFTGRDVRESFVLAARGYPVDLVFYDNGGDCRRAAANVEDAIARKIDLFVQYCHDPQINAAVSARLRSAGVRALSVNEPMPDAPLYTIDNAAAGRLAGDALADFAVRAWPGQTVDVLLIGPLSARGVPERVKGVQERLANRLRSARMTPLDTRGNLGQVSALVGKVLAPRPSGKVLVAAMDDATALAVKSALETLGRLHDAAIVSQGLDRSIHGGMSDRKEIDPANRGSIVLGSVAFYLDRLGYAVLPLALRVLRGEPVPLQTVTEHRLVTAANVFIEYPPYDMQ
jgi:ABC-type sugar transport system substrate-binding protein